jgi:hypothetical protein
MLSLDLHTDKDHDRTHFLTILATATHQTPRLYSGTPSTLYLHPQTTQTGLASTSLTTHGQRQARSLNSFLGLSKAKLPVKS